MNRTRIIGIIILILIIILAIVLLFIANLTILKKEEPKSIYNSANQTINNTNIDSINDVNIRVENTTNNVTVINDTGVSDVFYSNQETGKGQYTKEQLNNFSFELKGITNDIAQYIKNIDDFNITIKEYVYKHGLVDATIAEVQKYEYQENTKRLGVIFKLNNPDEDKLRVIVSSDDKIDISNYE